VTTLDVEAVGGPDAIGRARRCAELVALLRESVGEDRRWPDDLGPHTRLDADLALDSLEAAAFAARVREHYGDRVDVLAHVSALDIDAIINLTIADVAEHIAVTLIGTASPGDADGEHDHDRDRSGRR
jgi:acyl carrier protein